MIKLVTGFVLLATGMHLINFYGVLLQDIQLAVVGFFIGCFGTAMIVWNESQRIIQGIANPVDPKKIPVDQKKV